MSHDTEATKTILVRLFRTLLDDLTAECVRAVALEQRRHLRAEGELAARVAELERRIAGREAA